LLRLCFIWFRENGAQWYWRRVFIHLRFSDIEHGASFSTRDFDTKILAIYSLKTRYIEKESLDKEGYSQVPFNPNVERHLVKRLTATAICYTPNSSNV
jgi:hypothetical protein